MHFLGTSVYPPTTTTPHQLAQSASTLAPYTPRRPSDLIQALNRHSSHTVHMLVVENSEKNALFGDIRVPANHHNSSSIGSICEHSSSKHSSHTSPTHPSTKQTLISHGAHAGSRKQRKKCTFWGHPCTRQPPQLLINWLNPRAH